MRESEQMMSRVIKFRKWEKDLRIMYYGDNVGVWDSDMPLNRQFEEYRKSEYYELMQFTGLLDKSGKEIYEGDIVATGIGPDYVKSIVRIGRGEIYIDVGEDSYSRAYYGVYLERSCLEDLLIDGKMLVLGNIYEDEGLLKKDGEA